MQIREQSEVILGATLSLACVAVAAADFIGILGEFETRIPTLTLLLLGTVAAYLVVERRSRLARFDENLETKTAELQRALDVIRDGFAEIDARSTHIDAFFGAAVSNDRFSNLKLIYGSRAFASVIKGLSISVGREYIFQLWQDCISTADTVAAFNYVKAEEVWTTGWSFTIAQGVQAGRIASGATIRRVFVVDSQSEAAALVPLMEQQTAIGVDVRWILRSAIECRPFLMRYLDELGTWDLIALDEDLVFRVALDDDRSMNGCSLTRDSSLNSKVKHLFNEAYQFGSKRSDIP